MTHAAPVQTPLTRGLDRFLDLTIAAGYTRIGPGLRRRWWPQVPADALTDREVAVTGANSGLGLATALGAARLGAGVRLLCRSVERGEQAATMIRQRAPGARVSVHRCDVSDLDALPGYAAALREEVDGLDALVHNAGVMPSERTETDRGHELSLATHVLGPHLLTHLLTPVLRETAGRVVWVSSGGMYNAALRVDDPEYRRGSYSAVEAYARTKRMQVHLAERWASELEPAGIAVHSCHPGWADTPGVKESLPRFHKVTGPLLRSPDLGADTAVWLIAAPEAGLGSTGSFWHDRASRPTTYLGRHRPAPADVDALWAFCVEATGAPVSAT